MAGKLRHLGWKHWRLFGLAGDLHFGWSMLAQYVLPNGAAASLVTYLVGWRLSFIEYLAELSFPLRAGFYACLFMVAFALINHARLRLAASGGRDEGATNEERALEAQERWRGQEALDAYFGPMQQWLVDENRPLLKSKPGDQRRKLARTRTLMALRRSDPNGKRDVLEFLREQKLIEKSASFGQPIVRLADADLSGANLTNVALYGARLDDVDLSGADLSGAVLCWFIPYENNPNLQYPADTTGLSGAVLAGAVLRGATLAGCSLVAADFNGAVLDRADLRCADLGQARNLTQEQVNQAYGTHQQNRVPDTKLLEHVQAPEAWSKPINEQRRERGEP